MSVSPVRPQDSTFFLAALRGSTKVIWIDDVIVTEVLAIKAKG